MLGGVAGAPLVVPSDAFAALVAWGERVRASMPPHGRSDSAAGTPTASELTPERARVMEALADIIIPETDTPGAAEAGVTGFVTALVDGWLDDDDRDRFLAGLDTVDPGARERFGADFADCTEAQRTQLVGGYDAELTRLREDPEARASRYFFHDVKRFTITAYFTSEVGLDALGHRIVFRTFEGCAPLTPAEAGVPSKPGSARTGAPTAGARDPVHLPTTVAPPAEPRP